jgi:integrase
MYKREGSPFWFASYTDAAGRRIRQSTGCTDKREALAVESKWRLAARNEKLWDERPPLVFEEASILYLRAVPGKRERSSVKAMRKHLAGVRMDKLGPADVNGYKELRLADGVKKDTISRELNTLSAIINYANKEHGYALPNPVKGRKFKASEARIRWITWDEAFLLLKECANSSSKDLYLFVFLALHTGCRKSELYNLEWSRVDLINRLIHLEAVHTKANKRRSIPMSQAVWEKLFNAGVIAERNKQRYVLGGDKPVKNLDASFKSALKRAGIENFRMHDLRHTCAAWLVSAGVPLSAVRDLLGHASVTMSEKYAHLSPDAVRKAVSVFDEVRT